MKIILIVLLMFSMARGCGNPIMDDDYRERLKELPQLTQCVSLLIWPAWLISIGILFAGLQCNNNSSRNKGINKEKAKDNLKGII